MCKVNRAAVYFTIGVYKQWGNDYTNASERCLSKISWHSELMELHDRWTIRNDSRFGKGLNRETLTINSEEMETKLVKEYWVDNHNPWEYCSFCKLKIFHHTPNLCPVDRGASRNPASALFQKPHYCCENSGWVAPSLVTLGWWWYWTSHCSRQRLVVRGSSGWHFSTTTVFCFYCSLSCCTQIYTGSFAKVLMVEHYTALCKNPKSNLTLKGMSLMKQLKMSRLRTLIQGIPAEARTTLL